MLRQPRSTIAWVLGASLLFSQATTDTRDIYQAYRDGQIDIEVRGDGIDKVNGEVTRKAGTGPMILRIPPGTVFTPHSGGVQNMVVTSGTTVSLVGRRSGAFTAAVACSDIKLDVPSSDDRFEVGVLPERKRGVLKLFPVATAAGASFEVKQAAVWIVTDNADYDKLGTLTTSMFGLPGNRAINEPEAASAMMLLEKAGLDVESQSIWNNRISICTEVIGKGTSAAGWCGKVLRETTDAGWKVAILTSPNPALRNLARRGLLESKDDFSRAELINMLNTRQDLSDERTAVVAQALGNFRGPEVADALFPLLARESSSVRVATLQALTRTQDLRAAEAVRPLVLPSEPLRVRIAAIRSLGALGSTEEDLQALTEASDPAVKLEVQQAARKISARQRVKVQ